MRGALLAGCLVLLACAEAPPPPQPPPSEPPPRTLTLCERPAQPAAHMADPETEASFRVFAHGWLEKLRRAGTSRKISPEFETELRPTGDARAPWVGVLRYCETTGGSSAVVTELFRFEADEWVY